MPDKWKNSEIGGGGQAAIGDVAQEPMLEQRRAFYEAEGIRSLLVILMRIHGESFDTITFYYRKAHVWEESAESGPTLRSVARLAVPHFAD